LPVVERGSGGVVKRLKGRGGSGGSGREGGGVVIKVAGLYLAIVFNCNVEVLSTSRGGVRGGGREGGVSIVAELCRGREEDVVITEAERNCIREVESLNCSPGRFFKILLLFQYQWYFDNISPRIKIFMMRSYTEVETY
jgi:hypothetical protein